MWSTYHNRKGFSIKAESYNYKCFKMDDDKTKCIICWQVLGSKKQLLHGMKCLKFDIRDKLKSFLHPLDFKTLYNESVFPEPRVCNLCFIAVKQIPKGINKLQDLLGEPINLKLYMPHRKDWDSNVDDLKQVDRSLSNSPSTSACQDDSSDATKNLQKLTISKIKQSHKATQPSSRTKKCKVVVPKTASDSFNYTSKLHDNSKSLECPLTSATNPEKIKAAEVTKYKTRNEKIKYVFHKHSREDTFVEDNEVRVQLHQHRKLRKSYHAQEGTFSRFATGVNLTQSAQPVAHGQREDASQALAENENSIEESTLTIDVNIQPTVEHKKERRRMITRSTENTQPLPLTRSWMRLRSTQRQRKHNDIRCDKPVQSTQTVHYNEPIKIRGRQLSQVDDISDKTVSSDSTARHDSAIPQRSCELTFARNDNLDSVTGSNSKNGKLKGKSDVQITTIKRKIDIKKSKQKELKKEVAAGTILRIDIPAVLSKHSQKKLQCLTERAKKYLSSKRTSSLMIKCPEKGCEHSYPLWRHLSVHIRYYHYDGAPLPKNKFAQLMSKLADNSAAPDEGKKPHICDKDGYRKEFTTNTELIDHTNTHSKDTPHCCELCGKQFLSKSGLNNHQRKIHDTGKPGSYKCTFEGCNCTFVRKEKYELHLCTHTPERVLYCEKCGKQFGCQRYLDVHYKVHDKNVRNALHPPERTVACEVSGCDKKFTCNVYMKRHIISYHMGRRPRPAPGVFFTCSLEGCGKKFSLKSTLCRHNLLVHKGGDYKLNRTVVRYPCTASDCDMVFNRKNMLEKHMVTVHGQLPKKLLSHQSRKQDFKENMCAQCGMVLTDAQLLHHENVEHCSNSNQGANESSSYSCHLEGCGMELITQAERQAHVKSHIEKPPYKCEVEECKESFFLLKNLDNHLWNHSKKASHCDVDGCSQTFGDQLQLAKHSKVHYGGKMKCPWRNCGNWFTAMGTLKQHFLAHSRSLNANFGWDFVCNKCDRVFSSKYGLKNHKRTHEEKISGQLLSAQTPEFMCEEPGCKTEFSQHKQFFDHFLHHFTNTLTACKFESCTETLPTMLLQSKHGKSHYGGKYMCPWQDCDKMFASSFFQVKKHVYKHLLSIPTIAADRLHPCSQCVMVFRIQSNLTNHMAQHAEKSDYVCTVCGKKFHHNHLKRHMLTHRQEKPHACSHCGVRYGTVNGLKFHILQKHKIGKWPFNCSYCSKGFISSTEMRRHLPSHTKEKPFSCELCGDTFATHTGYKGHMRKHTGQKYVCEVEGCGKVYTTPLSMRGHKAQHEGFSKMCQFCGKTFKNPYGHKCKASRDAKQKGTKEEPLNASPNVRPSTSTEVSILAPTSAVVPIQHTVIIPPTACNHEAIVQQAGRITMVPNTTQHPHFMPSSVTTSITQGVPHVMPQALNHVLPNHSMMQDTSQPFSLDITKGTTMSIPGDYTFNNYVVFWDSQNLS